jgi:hypothetical protein
VPPLNEPVEAEDMAGALVQKVWYCQTRDVPRLNATT